MTDLPTPTGLDDPAVLAYLRELALALDGVAPEERALVLDGVTAHIADALHDSPRPDAAEVRAVLDGLGDPALIAASASPARAETAPPKTPFLDRRPGAVLAVLALAFGGIVVPFIGWIAGLWMLWVSRGWTTGEKVLGTLVLPGGFLGLLSAGLFPIWAFAGGAASCEASSDGASVCTESSPLVPTMLDGLPLALVLVLIAAQTTSSTILLRRFRPVG